MITTEHSTSKGQIRLESYRLSKVDTFISNFIKFFGFSNIDFVRSRGQQNWDTGFVSNTITNSGRTAQAQRVGGLSAIAAFIYIAVGTSNTAPAVTQTALGAELSTLGFSRVSVTPTLITTNVTNDTLQLQTTYTVTGTTSVEEIGIFNAASGVTMLGRALTGSKAVASGDTLIATYQVIYN